MKNKNLNIIKHEKKRRGCFCFGRGGEKLNQEKVNGRIEIIEEFFLEIFR